MFVFNLIIDDNLSNKLLLNKFNKLIEYLKKLNYKFDYKIINWYQLSDEDKKTYKDIFYLPSWMISSSTDILVISGDHLIKALKTKILDFLKEKYDQSSTN